MKKFFLINVALFFTFIICCVACSDDEFYSQGNTHRVTRPTSKSTSLFVATDRHETGSGNNLTAMLQTIAQNFNTTVPTTILLGGDYVGSGPDKGDTGQPVFNVTDVKADIIKALGCDAKYDVLLTYGSHDKGASEGYSEFYSGPRACDGYYTYGISYAQMRYATDSATRANDTTYVREVYATIDTITHDTILVDTINRMEVDVYDGLDLSDPFGISAESGARRFRTWVNTLSDHAPIVIMSHLPLHANRKDNTGALTWFRAISEAAELHSVIVFFCHNHTLEEKGNVTDAYNYMLTPGERIQIQSADSVCDKVLNFTYGNAGYVKLGFSSLVTFSDVDNDGSIDRLTICRYSVNGDNVDKFGLTGKKNPITLPCVR